MVLVSPSHRDQTVYTGICHLCHFIPRDNELWRSALLLCTKRVRQHSNLSKTRQLWPYEMFTPCKEHVELGDKFLSMLLPAELCWCWIIMLGCNWRLKFFINGKLLNRSVEWQVFDKQHHHNIIFTFATTSHQPLSAYSYKSFVQPRLGALTI